MAELPQVSHASQWASPPLERKLRRDLTGPDYFVCSIDPVRLYHDGGLPCHLMHHSAPCCNIVACPVLGPLTEVALVVLCA